VNPAATALEAQRRYMVERHLRGRGIRDERVLEAMGRIPRELFVPERYRHNAYCDEPIPIGCGQTISQPYITALMVQALELKGSERVLEVGAGSGYHAAVLGALAGEVITIEIIPELAEMAQRNLEASACGANVRVIVGDGSLGYPPEAPYDAISVAAAAPEIPPQLVDQLDDPGRLVIPIGSLDEQELIVLTKSGGATSRRVAALCRFVPLRGGEGWRLS